MEFLTDPVTWWVEPFADNPFMRDALWAGLLSVAATSMVGTWVVLRGMSFLGDALAHGVLPGIALAFVLGVDTTIGALAAALLMVAGIGLIRRHSPLSDDTSIGVLFVGFLALAVVVVSTEGGGYAGDLNRFLFGSIVGVDDQDLVRQGVAAAISVVGVIAFHRAFLVMTFDETRARLLGLRPGLAHAVLLGLLAVSIVASFETVGNLLVIAFLIAPPAAASLLARSIPLIMATAVLIGGLSVAVGLLVSFHADTATGATMALCAVAAFLLVLFATSVRRTIGDSSRLNPTA